MWLLLVFFIILGTILLCVPFRSQKKEVRMFDSQAWDKAMGIEPTPTIPLPKQAEAVEERFENPDGSATQIRRIRVWN